MHVRNLIRKAYEVITPYEGVASVEDSLLKSSFLVVMEKGKFFGVLTPSDILEHPHRLVIDCLRDKPHVDYEFKTEPVLRIMKENRTSVLPVFKGDELIGVVTQDDITDYLVEYRKDLQQEVAERTAEQTRAIEKLEQEIMKRERAEAEAKARQEQLIQADKMVSLGTLVSGVAHEINNPNNFVILNAPLLSRIYKDIIPLLDNYYDEKGDFMLGNFQYSKVREKVADLLEGIYEGSQRIKRIVEGLRDFAREDPADLSGSMNINSVVEGAVTLLENLINKSTSNFSLDLDENIPTVKGSFQRLEQVVINLLQNSCQALPDRGRGIHLSTAYDESTNSAVITLRDEGVGIEPENIKHITDPFFTTKRDYGGTGLGLSVSSGVIRDHGGTLNFISTPGEGTTAVVRVPCEPKEMVCDSNVRKPAFCGD